MKNILLGVLACCSLIITPAQGVKVTHGQEVEFKMLCVGGIFTIDGKPYVRQVSRSMTKGFGTIYPIKDNMDVEAGKPFAIDVKSKADVRLHKIIVDEGKTILFYSTLENKIVKIYYAELTESFTIKMENSTEVMKFELGEYGGEYQDFTVRQSPDGSKILLFTRMCCMVYASGMEELIWKLKFDEPLSRYSIGGDQDEFNTEKDQNDMAGNRLLINNEGRIFMYSVLENNNILFRSVGPNGDVLTNKEMKWPGFFVGTCFFRLSDNGNANLFFFYPPLHSKEELKADHGNNSLDRIITGNPNGFRVVEFDGNSLDLKSEHIFNNAERALFFPEVRRKANKTYLNDGFKFTHVITAPSGETVMVLEQPNPVEGKTGYVCVIVLNKELELLKTFSFMRYSAYALTFETSWRKEFRYWKSSNLCVVSFIKDELQLLFFNEEGHLQLVSFNDLATFKINDLGVQFSKKPEMAILNDVAIEEDKVILSSVKKNAFRVSSIQVK